jgi:hypothetical protein
MIVSADFLAFIVSLALAVTVAAPVVLLVLLVRDWIKDRLW